MFTGEEKCPGLLQGCAVDDLRLACEYDILGPSHSRHPIRRPDYEVRTRGSAGGLVGQTVGFGPSPFLQTVCPVLDRVMQWCDARRRASPLAPGAWPCVWVHECRALSPAAAMHWRPSAVGGGPGAWASTGGSSYRFRCVSASTHCVHSIIVLSILVACAEEVEVEICRPITFCMSHTHPDTKKKNSQRSERPPEPDTGGRTKATAG